MENGQEEILQNPRNRDLNLEDISEVYPPIPPIPSSQASKPPDPSFHWALPTAGDMLHHDEGIHLPKALEAPGHRASSELDRRVPRRGRGILMSVLVSFLEHQAA